MALQCSTAFMTLADLEGEVLVQFYTQLLGQKPAVYLPQVYAEFQLPELRLGIFKPKANHQAEFAGRSSGMSLCIEVEQLEQAIEAIEQVYAQLKAIGSMSLDPRPLGKISVASHGREIYAYDPAGNRLILHEAAQQ
jgi:predicted enzyme related to lactoylglutathione lyase